jgi:hypothetical protein
VDLVPKCSLVPEVVGSNVVGSDVRFSSRVVEGSEVAGGSEVVGSRVVAPEGGWLQVVLQVVSSPNVGWLSLAQKVVSSEVVGSSGWLRGGWAISWRIR